MKDVNQKLYYSIKKDENYDFSAAVNNNNIIKKHQKLFDQKLKSFQSEIRRSFCVSENLNFYDKKSNDYQLRYYRNFSKNADNIFNGNKRQNRFLNKNENGNEYEDKNGNENKICLVPTYLPPDPMAFRKEKNIDDKKNSFFSEERSFVNLVKSIKNSSDIKIKTRMKKIMNLSKGKNSGENEVENEVEDYLTPIEAPCKIARTNAYVQRGGGGLDSVSSAGTESQIKTPSQTQVRKQIQFIPSILLIHNFILSCLILPHLHSSYLISSYLIVSHLIVSSVIHYITYITAWSPALSLTVSHSPTLTLPLSLANYAVTIQ